MKDGEIINLLSHKITLKLESPGNWSFDGMGRASIKDLVININENMPIDSLQSVLLHEVMHLISDMCDIELTEAQVSATSLGMFSFMRGNPELIALISHGRGS